jgi:predicted nucleic acid-binding protein
MTILICLLAVVGSDPEEPLLIHPMTLAECLVGPAKSNQEPAFDAGISLARIATWNPDPHHPRRLARLRAATGLRPPDCCVLEVAIHTGAALATFDEHLAAVARTRVSRVLALELP